MAGKSTALGAVVLVLAAAGALAADPPAPSGKQRLICRGGGARQLGTHMRTRQRCRTAEEWREEEEEEEEKGRLPISLQATAGQNDGRQNPAPR